MKAKPILLRHQMFGNVALSVTRNNTLQKCVYCGKHMPSKTVGIVLRKGLSAQDVFVWCHVDCFPKFAAQTNEWIKNNQDIIKKVNARLVVESL